VSFSTLFPRCISFVPSPSLDALVRRRVLREIVTFISSVDNLLFGHVFEDMDSLEWRDRVSCDRWREILSSPIQVVSSLSV